MTDTQPSFSRDSKPDRLSIPAGTVIFAQGDAGNAAYLLESGMVSMRQSNFGQTVELDLIQAGEIFGEMAVLDGGNRMAAAVAVEDSTALRIPAEDFATLLQGTDAFLRGLILKFIKDIRASYRAFLRRPRSLKDHLRQMRSFTDNIRRFAAKLDREPVAPQLVASLDIIEAELDTLMRLSGSIADQRHDLIIDDEELQGLSVKAMLGSEARHKVTAPAEPPR
jgi:CRP/FNR family transcriptional regulator, cyclic AMP receptor protein